MAASRAPNNVKSQNSDMMSERGNLLVIHQDSLLHSLKAHWPRLNSAVLFWQRTYLCKHLLKICDNLAQ